MIHKMIHFCEDSEDSEDHPEEHLGCCNFSEQSGTEVEPCIISEPPTPLQPPPMTAELGCSNFDELSDSEVQPRISESPTALQPPPSDRGSAKPMNAKFYMDLRAGKLDELNRMLKVTKKKKNAPSSIPQDLVQGRDPVGDEESQLGQVPDAKLLNEVTPQQNTPLHIVARHGQHKMIEPILNHCPHLLKQQNMNGDLALHLAAGAGHLEAVKTIMTFVGEGDRESVWQKVNTNGETALHVAIRNKHIKVARFLIESHPKASFCLDARRESPLYLAAELGELKLVKQMIAEPSEDDVQSQPAANLGDNSEDVQSHNALEKNKSVVHAAILGGKPEVLREILSTKYKDLNPTAEIIKEGRISPLSCAALKGEIQMVREIQKTFRDCAFTRDLNASGTYPIHIAAGAGHVLIVKEFLRIHPDSGELLTTDRENILHKAADHGKDDVVRYILGNPDLNELINAKDKEGNTPLHKAVAAKYPKVVDALTWDKRVRMDLLNNDGQTAMDLALKFDGHIPSFQEKLTMVSLRYAGAPKRKLQETKISEQAILDTYKDRVNTFSVVATLVTTMSFAAGFTMPGGNGGSDSNLGMANFLNRRIFQVFVISNSVALYTSVLNVLVLIFAMLGDVKLLHFSLKVAGLLLAGSLVTMSISFMSAAYLVVSSLRWLGIVVLALGSVFLAAIVALFFLLFTPQSRKHRYLAYLPFRVVLYISGRK